MKTGSAGCGVAIDRRTLMVVALASSGFAQVGWSDPPRRSFSSEGLAALRARLGQAVARGYVPGLVGLIARGPDVETFAIGHADIAGARAMRRDQISRAC